MEIGNIKNHNNYFSKLYSRKRRYVIIYLLTLVSVSMFSQIAHFPFNTDLNDVVQGYVPAEQGSPALITLDGNQAVELEGDEYLELPNALHQSIDPNQDLEIQIKFKITDTYADTPYSGNGLFGDEGKRILVSNKFHHIYDLGFEIYTQYMDEEYRLLMSFGDDLVAGGTFIFTNVIEEDEWVDLRLIFRLNKDVPDIVYKLNGYYSHFPLNYLDVNLFKQSLDTQDIWIGTDNGDFQQFENYAYAEVAIDNLKIFNPVSDGNASLVSAALDTMVNHVNGTHVLTQAEQLVQVTTITNEWDDNTFTEIKLDILEYIDTYEQHVGRVFINYPEAINPKEVSLDRALQYMLIQYCIDNVYTNDNVASMAGIDFIDYENMLGTIPASAPRITSSASIDGTYNSHPAYYLNNQEFVIRPTGFYVAPGELVDITLPSSVVDQGVRIHVGAHFVDLREDSQFFGRFPTMATKFPVDSTTTAVTNPFGGAIYLIFPDGSNFGSVNLQVANAVKSPYYSSKAGFSNSLAEFQTDLNNAYVQWVDVESDHFMATFPRALAIISPDPGPYMDPIDEMVANFNVIAGRPLQKIRSEYIISEPQLYTSGTIPASYPMSIINGDLTESDQWALPVSALDPDKYINTFEGTTLLHELGHLHNIPTMYEEDETNVDVPTVMGIQTAFNMPLDTAFYYSSGFQFLTRDQAALDWMLDTKFRNKEMAEFLEVSYQLRGIAKYIDVVGLHTWDSLGLIHQHWYEEALASGMNPLGIQQVSPDEYIEVASDQLDYNFAPLWEFWGSLPSDTLKNQLDGYNSELRIRDRILHYRNLVPVNASEFLNVYNEITPNIEEHHVERYDDLLQYYDASVADSIISRIDEILCEYFDTNCTVTDVDVLLEPDAITLLPNPTIDIFEIQGPMGDYTIRILDAAGNLVQTVTYSGSEHAIDISMLPAGLLFIEINNPNNLTCMKKIIKL